MGQRAAKLSRSLAGAGQRGNGCQLVRHLRFELCRSHGDCLHFVSFRPARPQPCSAAWSRSGRGTFSHRAHHRAHLGIEADKGLDDRCELPSPRLHFGDDHFVFLALATSLASSFCKCMPSPRDLRFPKSRRLVQPSEFERVKKEGRSERGALLILGVLQSQDRHPLRAGFVTSKRIGGAVVRNQVRRRLREIVRKHQQDLRADLWIVIIARPKAARATYRELEDEWLRLAKRASILAA